MKSDLRKYIVYGFIYNFFITLLLSLTVIVKQQYLNLYIMILIINGMFTTFLMVLLTLINPDIEMLMQRIEELKKNDNKK